MEEEYDQRLAEDMTVAVESIDPDMEVVDVSKSNNKCSVILLVLLLL